MPISGTRAAVLVFSLPAAVAAGSTHVDARVRLAQGSVTIPSDAQLNRLEREAITTPPLDVGETPPRDEQGAQGRQRDRRDRRIDRRLPERGGACDDC
ncbi:hypothetical protein ACRAWG_26105 [Methylobacterium sp. P31]